MAYIESCRFYQPMDLEKQCLVNFLFLTFHQLRLLQRIFIKDVRPVSEIAGNSPIEILFSAQNGMDYIYLKRSRLYVKLKIINGENALTDADIVGPVNLLLQSLFSEVDVSMRNKPINNSGAHYPYLSMLNTLLSYGSDAKSSQLSSQLWESDHTGDFDDANAKNGENFGILKRTALPKSSKTIDLEGPIMHELFKMGRFILNQVGISLVIFRVCKCKINPAVIISHAKMLEKTTAKYPFKKSVVKIYNLAMGLLNASFENMFSGTRPDRLCMGSAQ